jgi:hypothetical protein
LDFFGFKNVQILFLKPQIDQLGPSSLRKVGKNTQIFFGENGQFHETTNPLMYNDLQWTQRQNEAEALISVCFFGFSRHFSPPLGENCLQKWGFLFFVFVFSIWRIFQASIFYEVRDFLVSKVASKNQNNNNKICLEYFDHL